MKKCIDCSKEKKPEESWYWSIDDTGNDWYICPECYESYDSIMGRRAKSGHYMPMSFGRGPGPRPSCYG